MPKRTLEVIIEPKKFRELLILHAEGSVDAATVEQIDKDTWRVLLPVKQEYGMATTEIVEFTKQEVDEILFQEARVANKVDISGGGQSIKYLHNEQGSLELVKIEFQGTRRVQNRKTSPKVL